MKESLGFTFNGVHSSKLGVYSVHTSSSLYTEQAFIDRVDNLLTNSKTGDTVLEKTQQEPFKFTLTLLFDNWKKSKQNFREVVRWLITDNFEELIFDTHPKRVVFAKVTKFEELNHNGLNEGFVNVEFTTNSSTVYSKEYSTGVSVVEDVAIFSMYNEGDTYFKPFVWIEKRGKGDIRMQVNNEKPLEIKNLNGKEKIFIDNKRRFILSSQEEVGVYRANDHNGVWLEVPASYQFNEEDRMEHIRVEGNCTIEIKWREEFYSFH